jgi:WD40 repeat protein
MNYLIAIVKHKNQFLKVILVTKLFLTLNSTTFGQTPELQFPLSHTDRVIEARISPDGKYLVSASIDNTAKIWDIENGKLLYTLDAYPNERAQSNNIWENTKHELKDVRFSGDGKFILSYYSYGGNYLADDIIIWDAITGIKFDNLTSMRSKNGCEGLLDSDLEKWKKVNNYPKEVHKSSNGKYYLNINDNNSYEVEVFDAVTGNSLLKTIKGVPIFEVTFTPDGNHIFAIDQEYNYYIYDIPNNKLVVKRKTEDLYLLSFSSEGNFALIGSPNKSGEKNQILLVEIATGVIISISEVDYFISQIVFDEKSNNLFVTHGDNDELRLVNFHLGKIRYEIYDDFSELYLDKEGSIISVMKSGELLRLNMENGSLKDSIKFSHRAYNSVYYSNTIPILTSFFDCNEKISNEDSLLELNKRNVLSILTNEGIQLDTNTEILKEKIYLGNYSPYKNSKCGFLSFSDDGRLMITSNSENAIEIWDIKKISKIIELKGSSRKIISQNFIRNNSELVLEDDSNTFRILEVGTGKIIFSKQLPAGSIFKTTKDENVIKVQLPSKDYIFYNVKTGIRIPDSLIEVEKEWWTDEFSEECKYEFEYNYKDNATLYLKSDHSVIKSWDPEKYYYKVWDGKFLCIYGENHQNEIINLITGDIQILDGIVVFGSWKNGNVLVLKKDEIALYDVVNAKWIKSMHDDLDANFVHEYDLESNLLYLNCKDGLIKVWDIENGKISDSLLDMGAEFDEFYLFRDYLLAFKHGKYVTVFNKASGKMLCRSDFFDFMDGVEVSSDQKNLMVYSANHLSIIDLNEGKQLASFEISSSIGILMFTDDGKFIGDRDGENLYFNLYQISSGMSFMKAHNRKMFESTNEEAGRVRQSTTGKFISTNFWSLYEGYVKIWDSNSGKLVHDIFVEKMKENDNYEGWMDVIWSQTDKYIMISSYNDLDGFGRNKLIDIATGKQIFSFLSDEGQFAGFSADDKFFYTSVFNKLYVWDIATGKKIHEHYVGGYALINEDKVILQDQTKLLYWDLKQNKQLLTWISLGPNDHVVIHPDGYFDGTPEGISKLFYKKGLEFIPVEAYFEQFYRPGLWERIMSGQEIEKSSIDFKTQKPLPGILFLNPTTRKIEFRGNVSQTTDNANFDLKFRVTDLGGGVDEVRVYQNGKLVYEAKESISLGEKSSISLPVVLQSGMNEFKVSAFNQDRLESTSTAIIKFTGKDISPSELYCIAIGINGYQKETYNLNYAVPDADAFKNALLKSGSKIFSHVHMKYIIDKNATKSNILKEIEVWKDSIKPNDVFVFYYAGHGSMSAVETESKTEFYLVPHDVTNLYSSENLLEKGISAEELQKISKEIKAQKQLFILDACQSGGALNQLASRGAVEEKAMAILARSTGTYWLTASGSEQLAGEFATLGHGVFTFSLLMGLSGMADSDIDGKISVKELSFYIEKLVPELSEKFKGNAQYPVSYGFGQDFPLAITNTFQLEIPELKNGGKYSGFSLDELEKMKKAAASSEEYEKASEIKIEIEKRKSNK